MPKRIARIFLAIAAALSAISLLMLLSLAVWVLSGPKSIAKLVPYIETSLNREGAPYQLTIGDAVIVWQDASKPVDLRLQNIRIATRTDDQTLLRLSEVSVGLDLSALSRLKIEPLTVVIRNPSIWFYRDGEGEFFLGIGDEDEHRLPLAMIIDGLESAGESGDQDGGASFAGGIKSIQVLNGRLRLGEPGGKALLVAPDADLNIYREGHAIRAGLQLSLQHGEQMAGIKADVTLANQRDMLTAKLELEGFSPMVLAKMAPETWQDITLDVPFSGWADIVVDDKGTLALVDFSLDGGGGIFNYPEHFAETLAVTHIHIQGQMRDNLRQFMIKQSMIDFGGATLSINGLVSRLEAGMTADTVAVVENMPVNDLYKYWPKSVAPTPYEWVTTNIREGTVPRAEARLKITAEDLGGEWPESAFDAVIEAKGVNVAYLPGHPKVEDVDGKLHFTTKAMEITSNKGNMLSGTKLKDAFLRIPDLTANPAPMHIRLKIDAPAKDVVQYIDNEALNYAKPLGLDAEQVTGQVNGQLQFDFNLPSRMPDSKTDLKMQVQANLDNVSQPDFMGYMNLSQVTGKLGINTEELTYDGQIAWDGLPMQVSLRHDFVLPEDGFPTRYNAKAIIPAEKLTVFGLPTMDFLQGTAGMDALIKRRPDGVHTLEVKADLAGMSANIPLVGLSKKAREPASLQLQGDVGSGALVLKEFAITAPDIHISGSAALRDNMQNLQMLRLDRVEFADNNFATTVEEMQGGYRLRAKGPSLDLKPYFSKRKQGSERTFVRLPFALDVHGEFDWVVIGQERELRHVNARFDCNPNWCEQALITGLTGQKNEFKAEIGPVDGIRRMIFRTANAGSFLKAMDIYDGMDGGELTIGAVFDDTQAGRPLNGKLRITGNTIRNVPFLAKIASLMSLTGISDSLSGKGVTLDVIEGDFTMNEQFFNFQNGKAVGPALGVTVDEGRINRVTDEVWLSGTFVPSYTLNTALGNLPVVGQVFSGGKGEGMFAAKYTVSGTYPDNTDVDVDGLSMLAPGFLRNLVGSKEAPPQVPVVTP